MRPAALAANAAIPRHHSVPLKMKIPPSSKNASVSCGESAATNCGRKARKNSATFGLSALVNTPCQNTRRKGTASPGRVTSTIGAARAASGCP
jgi:hypothetical protein